MRFRCPLLSVLALVLLSSTAMAQQPSAPDATALLEQMVVALDRQSYSGQYTYSGVGKQDAVHVDRLSEQGRRYERLTFLSGEPTVILLRDGQVFCIYPERAQVVAGDTHQSVLQRWSMSDLSKMRRWYQYTLDGHDYVAGRGTQRLSLQARDQQRYSYKLWLDEKTKLLLRYQVLNLAGEPVEEMMFTQIDTEPHLTRARFSKPQRRNYDTWQHEASAVPDQQGDLHWGMRSMPAGFDILSNQSVSIGKQPGQRMILSDGLAMVSVYIEKARQKKNKLLPGASQVGLVNAYVRQLGDFSAVVLGEIPRATAIAIGDAISRLDE